MQNKEIQDKSKKMSLDKYGFKNPASNELVKTKIKVTFKNNYGDDSPNRVESVKQAKRETCKAKYGVDNLGKVYEFKEKAKETCRARYGEDNPGKVPECKEKARKTCIAKYGFDHQWKVPEIIQKCITKSNETKRKNGTFNTSKPEDEFYEILKTKYGDSVIRNFKNDRYPFACDFYIPEKDLFIELQLFWTHGKEAFNKDKQEHQEKLRDWQNKKLSSNFYKLAIEVWTSADVKKRNIAKQNNLNYIEWFSLEEAKIKLSEI